MGKRLLPGHWHLREPRRCLSLAPAIHDTVSHSALRLIRNRAIDHLYERLIFAAISVAADHADLFEIVLGLE